jgi:uncharacterized membrane protein
MTRNWTLAGIGSALVFLGCVFVVQMNFFLALGVAVLSFVGLILVLGVGPAAADAVLAGEEMTKAEAMLAIRKAQGHVRELRKQNARIADRVLSEKGSAICAVADDILDQLKTNPRGIKNARRFLDYYLDATGMVMQRYADLFEKGGDSAAVQHMRGKFGDLLDTIRDTCARQRDRLLKNEALDLDTEITVLKQMMNMEGL